MTKTKTVNKLSSLQVHKLFGHIEAKYAAAKLSDDAFAVQATKELGFDVFGSNVANARIQLGIEGTKTIERAAKPSLESLLARIDEQEKKIKSLEEWRLQLNLSGVVGVAYSRSDKPLASKAN